jgi:hypothetical protein
MPFTLTRAGHTLPDRLRLPEPLPARPKTTIPKTPRERQHCAPSGLDGTWSVRLRSMLSLACWECQHRVEGAFEGFGAGGVALNRSAYGWLTRAGTASEMCFLMDVNVMVVPSL